MDRNLTGPLFPFRIPVKPFSFRRTTYAPAALKEMRSSGLLTLALALVPLALSLSAPRQLPLQGDHLLARADRRDIFVCSPSGARTFVVSPKQKERVGQALPAKKEFISRLTCLPDWL